MGFRVGFARVRYSLESSVAFLGALDALPHMQSLIVQLDRTDKYPLDSVDLESEKYSASKKTIQYHSYFHIAILCVCHHQKPPNTITVPCANRMS